MQTISGGDMDKIVILKAVDWGVIAEQITKDFEFTPVQGTLVGLFVQEDDNTLVITQQKFDDGGLRSTLIIPKVCIREWFEVSTVTRIR